MANDLGGTYHRCAHPLAPCNCSNARHHLAKLDPTIGRGCARADRASAQVLFRKIIMPLLGLGVTHRIRKTDTVLRFPKTQAFRRALAGYFVQPSFKANARVHISVVSAGYAGMDFPPCLWAR